MRAKDHGPEGPGSEGKSGLSGHQRSHGGPQGKEAGGPRVRLPEMGMMTVPSSGGVRSAWVTARPPCPSTRLTLLCLEERGGLQGWAGRLEPMDFLPRSEGPTRQGIPWEFGFLMRGRGSRGPGLQDTHPSTPSQATASQRHSPLPPALDALTKQSSSAQMT